MNQHLDKTGDPPQKRQRNLLKAGLLAVSMGTLLPTTALATIQGSIFMDWNDNATKDIWELPLTTPKTVIFLRDNTKANSGQGGFFSTETDSNGNYSFPVHDAGSFTIWSGMGWGWRQTAPSRGEGIAFHDFNVANKSDTVTINFGLFDGKAPANNLPVIAAGDKKVKITLGDSFTFVRDFTDADAGDRHFVEWDFGDGNKASKLLPAKTYSSSTAYTYTQRGTYTATFKVTDSRGDTVTTTITVTVEAPPIVNVGNDIALDVGEAFKFNGTFTDPDGKPRYDYTWKFGDGNTSVGRTWSTKRPLEVTHAFNQAGEFTLTLKITDKNGNKGSDSLIVNVRGINTDPCATGVAQVYSRNVWGIWDYPSTWTTGRAPGPNDWVRIKAGHTVIFPSSNAQIRIKGLCIEQNAVLQSAFNQLNSPPSQVEIYMSSLSNQGTITGANGVNAAPINGSYKRATASSNIKIWGYKLVNEGLIKSNGAGDDKPYLYLPHRSRWNTLGGAGGVVELYPAIMINNGRIEGGKGGNAYNNAYTYAHGRSGYYTHGHHTRTVHGSAYGGSGGFVRVFATNLGLSINTGQFVGGCGGNAFGVRHSWGLGAGKGGNIYANVGTNAGRIKGCTGSVSWWDPTTLKATNTTVIEGTDHVIIFGGTDWVMDLSELREGSVSAAKTITISLGKGGVIDLPTAGGKVFQAAEKVEIFADHFRLNGATLNAQQAQAVLESLTDAPSLTVSSHKILYRVEMSHPNHIVGEPGETVPIKLTVLNGGPTTDTYDINVVSHSADWEMDTEQFTVTVNSMRRSEVEYQVKLPETRGAEMLLTITATSQANANVQSVADIRIGVKEQEAITPRGDKKADLALIVQNTNTMVGELMTLSNTIEDIFGQLGGELPPQEEGLTGEALENMTDAELEALLNSVEVEELKTPTVELMTFNDDAVTTRVVTDDFGEIIGRIRSLQPSGNECPTTTVAALESALDNLNANGQIFLVTSASPQGDTAAAIAKAQQLGVKVHILLAGSCGNEEADKAIYQEIVDQTGGDFNQIRRGQMPAVEIEQVVTTVVEDTITEVAEMVKERGKDEGTEPPVTPASCMVYGVHDKGKNDSIFFSIDFETEKVTQLGPIYEGYDIEAMTVSPDKDILYVGSGNDTDDPLPKGHVYYLDASTGDLVALGPSGFEEIGGLAFAGDGTLWAWAKGDGLVQLNPVTGQGTLELPTPALLEDLTAARDGTVLYGPLEDQLWSYDPTTGTLTLECDNLERETEAVEFLLDGILLLGRNGEKSLKLHAFDIATCSMVANRNIKVPFNDVEGLAVPHAACLH